MPFQLYPTHPIHSTIVQVQSADWFGCKSLPFISPGLSSFFHIIARFSAFTFFCPKNFTWPFFGFFLLSLTLPFVHLFLFCSAQQRVAVFLCSLFGDAQSATSIKCPCRSLPARFGSCHLHPLVQPFCDHLNHHLHVIIIFHILLFFLSSFDNRSSLSWSAFNYSVHFLFFALNF